MVILTPGAVCYDDFIDEHYLLLELVQDKHGRPYWRMLALREGETVVQLERMLVEDPDVRWLE